MFHKQILFLGRFKFGLCGKELFLWLHCVKLHSVFKRLVQQTCKNQGLFGKGLKMNVSF